MPDLASISARDIMSSHLLTVCESWSIQTLIDFFNEKKISGAPVLSKNGDIIGVVSLSDIINFDVNPSHSLNENPMSQYYLNTLEGFSPDELGLSNGNQHKNHLVSEIMTPKVIALDIDKSAAAIANEMSNNSIHRVFISNRREICGVVSSLDILKLFDYAA
ncbi:MAG: CBS domain-containing protein [Neptuniibacter sp.]